MISVNEFLQTLRTAHDVPNYYCNKYPKNLGYFDGSKYSFDCWNLVKVVLSGWHADKTPGYFVHADKLVTGDVDGATILKNCTEQSKDFSKLLIPGTYLYLATNPHAGVFVGEFAKDGKVYNVIECTKGMYAGQDGVTYSYVDYDGTRRAWKGGNAKLRWTDYGLLTKWVSYNDIPKPVEPEKPSEDSKDETEYYTVKKGDTLSGIAAKFGTTVDDILAVNPQITNPDLIYPGQEIVLPSSNDISKKEYYTVKKGDTLSDIARKLKIKISKLLELNPQIKNPDLIYPGDKLRVK